MKDLIDSINRTDEQIREKLNKDIEKLNNTRKSLKEKVAEMEKEKRGVVSEIKQVEVGLKKLRKRKSVFGRSAGAGRKKQDETPDIQDHNYDQEAI